MSALTEYIDAWIANDADRVAAAVAEDCIITECYGPVYRGRTARSDGRRRGHRGPDRALYEWQGTWR